MTVSNELVWLLNQLRNAPQPKERLRLLAVGYRTLRDLPPSDRRRVAQELGVEGAEQLVDQLAHRGGASPAVLLEALRRLESADPGRIRDLVNGLLDQGRRSEIVEHALDEAAHWLVEDRQVPPPAAHGEPAIPPAPSTESAATVPESPPAAAPEVATVDAVETAPAPRTPQDPVQSTGVVLPEKAGSSEHEPEPGRPPVGPGSTPTRPTSSDAPVPVERSPAPTPRPIREVPRVPSPAEHGRELTEHDRGSRPAAGRLPPPVPPVFEEVEPSAAVASGARSLMERLRELTRSVDGLSGARQGELVDLLERFPAGWARRRALETLLRAGLPVRVEDALELVDTVGDEVGRTWALTTLVVTRSLDAEEVDAVLGAAGSSASARRIRSRLARSR